MEVIWGNRLKPGTPNTSVAFRTSLQTLDAGDDRVGRWLGERIDLAAVHAEIWKDAGPAHLVDIAVFCDSDDTHTASASYSRMCGLKGGEARSPASAYTDTRSPK